MNDLYTFSPTKIVVYTTEHCLDCNHLRAFFKANDIACLSVGLEGNSEASDFVMKINDGYQSVPTIIFPDSTILVEPSWKELRAKLSNS